MIFDELIKDTADIITDGIDTIKDATSDIREEVHDTNKAAVQAVIDILKALKR